MLRQTVRNNTFETNSSSTHSMCIIPDRLWADWKNNKLYYMRWTYGDENKKLLEENNGSRLFTEEFLKAKGRIKDAPKEEDFEDYDEFEEAFEQWEYDCEDEDFVNFDGWDNIDLEGDHEEYITEAGEKLHIMCKYGYDG